MAITQVYTAIPGDVITATRWNNEFGNIYNNFADLSSASVIATGSSEARALSTRFADRLNVKDFGAVGDGVANDYTALNAALVYVAANGGTIYMPAGTYLIDSGIILTSAAQPFHLVGAGPQRTIIKRSTNFAGSTIEIRSSNDWSITNLTINGNHAVFTGGNHGLAFRDCNRVYLGRLFVTDYKSAGIIGFSATPGVATHGDNVVEQCTADGLAACTLGIMVADQYRTRFVNCVAKNIDTASNPGYGIQFKNNCRDCVMINPQVFTARMGIVISNDKIDADDSFDNRVYGGYAFNCLLTGLDFGGVNRSGAYDVKIDMNNQGNDACTFDDATIQSEVRISTVDVPVAKSCVKFSTNCFDNYAVITSMSQPALGAICFGSIISSATSLRNTVILNKVVTPVITSASNLFSNASDSTNTFESQNITLRNLLTIATDIITVGNGKIQHILVDTEAAAATDDLATINGGNDYQQVTLTSTSSTRDIVVKHNTGNIVLNGLADFTLDNTADTLTLLYRSTLSKWVEVGRSNNL